MEQSEIGIIKKIDLHYGKRDFSENKNYVEFYFYCCFYELLNVENSSWETNLSGNEIFDLLSIMKIYISKDFLVNKYQDYQNHDVEVFHSDYDEQVFAYFDLQKEPTDQNDMFFLGIRCLKNEEELIHKKLLEIYRKLGTTSAFSFDIWNHQLYNKTFSSYFFFYEQNYNQYKRKINNHNPH